MDLIKFQNFVFQQTPFVKIKGQAREREKYLQIIYLIKDVHKEYTNNSYTL